MACASSYTAAVAGRISYVSELSRRSKHQVHNLHELPTDTFKHLKETLHNTEIETKGLGGPSRLCVKRMTTVLVATP